MEWILDGWMGRWVMGSWVMGRWVMGRWVKDSGGRSRVSEGRDRGCGCSLRDRFAGSNRAEPRGLVSPSGEGSNVERGA